MTKLFLPEADNPLDSVKLPVDHEVLLGRLEALTDYVRRGAIGEKQEEDMATILEAMLTIVTLRDRMDTPIPMLLFCPVCDAQHVDMPQPEKNWTNPPHKSHECQACGHVWRPCDRPTVGVASIGTTGTRDGRASPARLPVETPCDQGTKTTIAGEPPDARPR